MGNLTALDVKRASKPGMVGDGQGLWLQVTKSGGKSWSFRFMLKGRSREMGLGAYPTVTLAQARDLADAARKVIQVGSDPIEARKSNVEGMTFDEAAAKFIKANEKSWKRARYKKQWEDTLRLHVSPVFGKKLASEVSVIDVMKALEPIWYSIKATARIVRRRIEAILDYAKAMGLRSDENPARWKGHLQILLPPKRRDVEKRHYAAMPWTEVGEFVRLLRKQETTTARALEFLILTVGRSMEILEASWDEIDIESATWIVPKERMKGDRDHRVPLSKQALELLASLDRRDKWVFPGGVKGKSLSDASLGKLLQRMKHTHITSHGFRSSFRDWVPEKTDYSRDLAEMSLAHIVGDATETAYRRTDLLEKRRPLMQDWANFISIIQKD